jgi:hypothetical protein
VKKALTFAYNACIFALIALVLAWIISSQSLSSTNFLVRLIEVWYLMALLFLISSYFGIIKYSNSIIQKIIALMIIVFGLWYFLYIFTQPTPFIVPNHIAYYLYHLTLIVFLSLTLKEKNKLLTTQAIFAILLVLSQTLLSVLNFRLNLSSMSMTSIDYLFLILYYIALLRFFDIYRKKFNSSYT